MDYEDEEEEDDYGYGQHYGHQRQTATPASLRSDLARVADTWERKKQADVRALNSRIATLTNQKRTAEVKSDTLQAELRAKEEEMVKYKAESKEMETKVGLLEDKLATASRQLCGVMFVVAELVEAWPALPDPAAEAKRKERRKARLELKAAVAASTSTAITAAEKEQKIEDEDEDEEKVGEDEEDPSRDDGWREDEEDEDEEDDGESILLTGEGQSEKPNTPTKKKNRRGGKKHKKGGAAKAAAAAAAAAAVAAEGQVVLPPPPPTAAIEQARAALLELEQQELEDEMKEVEMVVTLPKLVTLPDALLTRKSFCELAVKGNAKRIEEVLGGMTMQTMEDMVTETISIALRQAADTESFTGSDLRVCKALLGNGADASFMGHYNSGEEHGELKPFAGVDELSASPLHYAVKHGHDALCQLLIQNKSNINALEPTLGRTPLHYAAQYNKPKLAKLLVQKGAFVDAKDNNSDSALEIAERLKWKKVAATLTDPSVLFWNYTNRANKMYKAGDYDIACDVYAKAFDMLVQVKPQPSEANQATLHYNYARAAICVRQHVLALEQCEAALKLKPDYHQAREQRAKCHMALYNYDMAIDDYKALCKLASSGTAGDSLDAKNVPSWERQQAEALHAKNKTHYDILGVEKTASASELKKAYRTQCLQWHPDKHATTPEGRHRAHFMFQRVNEANEVLSNPTKRSAYDRSKGFSSYGGGARRYSHNWGEDHEF